MFLNQQAAVGTGVGYLGCLMLLAVGWLLFVFTATATETDKCLTLYKTISGRHAGVVEQAQQNSPEFYRRIHDLENELFTALEQCPQDPLLFSLMAENQIALNNIQLASLYAAKAHQQRPEIWQTNHAMGTTLIIQQQYDEGLSLLEKAAQIAPEKPALQFNLCRSYVTASRFQLAVKACSQLLEKKGHQLLAVTYFQRSLAYRALGKAALAEADQEKVRELTPPTSLK